MMSWGSVTSRNGEVPRFTASPLAVNHEVSWLPSMVREGGLLEKKLLAVATVPGSRARLAPPGLTALRSSKSSGIPSPSRSISSSTSSWMVAMTPSFVAVMSTVPLDWARTKPSVETVAMAEFEGR